MGTMPVKIPVASDVKLVGIAATRTRPMGDILADLTEREARQAFLEGANADVARPRASPEAWADYQTSFQSMEGTMMNGLEDDPWVEPDREESTSVPEPPRPSTDTDEPNSPWRR